MFENFSYYIERFFTITISFLFVIFISVWVERYIKLLNMEQSRPTSILIRQKNNRNLLKFLSRYGAIGLRYAELIVIAIFGLFLEYFVRIWITNSYQIILPIILIFIPFSFFTIVLCVPEKSKKYFEPYWYEIVIGILLFIIGLWWLISLL